MKKYPNHEHTTKGAVVICTGGPPECKAREQAQIRLDEERGGTATGRRRKKAGS